MWKKVDMPADKSAVGSTRCCAEPKKNAATRIFETAKELFYQRGIRAVGVDEIVCQAGVTKPSLYRSFASKDALVAACLEHYAAESSAEIEKILARAGDDPRARLDAYVDYYARKIAEPGFRGCPGTNAAVEFPEAGHPGRVMAETCKIDARAQLVILTRALAVREPEALADGLILLIEGAFSTHHVFGSQGPAALLSEIAKELIDMHVAKSQR